jgi:hypothetical protein
MFLYAKLALEYRINWTIYTLSVKVKVIHVYYYSDKKVDDGKVKVIKFFHKM